MALQDLTRRYLDLHLALRPVDSTFMGYEDRDHELPPATPAALEQETSELASLALELRRQPAGATAEDRIARAALHGAVQHALRENEARPRLANPAWYTGEAAFGLIALLLRTPSGHVGDALRQRVEALPAFLAAGAARLAGAAAPADWVTRAKLEAQALERLLTHGLPLHALAGSVPPDAVAAACKAAAAFASSLAPSADSDPAAPAGYLAHLFAEVHQLPMPVKEAEALALEGFERARAALEAKARAADPEESWRAQLARLEGDHPPLPDVIATYSRLHERAMAEAERAGLVTPALGYGLRFAYLPEWARGVAHELYFLFYRSPAAMSPGSASPYWVFAPGADLDAYLRGQSYATIKLTHAVHHGSIGHHTQNARARESAVPLGRLAGTDCASGIALLAGGTMIEGWACYSQDLLLEADGFYTPAEELLLAHAELRNTAMCLADIRLHTGVWSLAQMRAFYEDEVGIGSQRAWTETTRNSMWPSTRSMYWLGTRAIRQFRRDVGGEARRFHDALLAFGSVPVYPVGEELLRAKERA